MDWDVINPVCAFRRIKLQNLEENFRASGTSRGMFPDQPVSDGKSLSQAFSKPPVLVPRQPTATSRAVRAANEESEEL